MASPMDAAAASLYNEAFDRWDIMPSAILVWQSLFELGVLQTDDELNELRRGLQRPY